MRKPRWVVLSIGTLAFAWAIAALLALYQFSFPIFFNASYEAAGKKEFFSMPFNIWWDDRVRPLEVEMDVYLSPLHPNIFRIAPDDCIEDLWINDRRVEDENAYFCDLKGRDIYLGEYLHAGTNTLRLTLKDAGLWASLRIRVANNDPLLLALRAALFLTVVLYGLFLLKFASAKRNVYVLFFIVMLAAGFAKYYDYNIPYYDYAYDFDGHVDYVEYVYNHWSIPPAGGGWEYYQPPLYYFILAVVMKVGSWMHRGEVLLWEDMETMSWLFITASLFVTAWISTLLFPKRSEWKYQYLFTAFVGFMPAVIFQASRITNDVLFYLVTLCMMAFLLRWWQRPNWRDWYVVVLIIGVGLLVKSNVIPLIPVALLCLAMRPGIPLKRKILLGISALLIIVAIAGAYQYQRFIIEGQRGLVGNLNTLNVGMLVTNEPSDYLTFNPFKVLDIPFNNDWSDAYRRNFFWEYFLRSMYFGSFDFGREMRSLATVLLMVTLPLVLVCVLGAAKDMRAWARGHVPLWALGGALGAAALGYRITAPYSCNQDFRFIAPVVIVFAFYLLSGARMLPKKAEHIVLQIMGVCIILSAVFLFLLVR